MLSIQQMNYILVLSEQRQFQKASEICFVTQPTLSMQVKKAEDELGYQIFDRSRNPIGLTEFGESLVPIIREILIESSKIEVLTQKLKGNYREQVRVGVIPTVAAYLVPDLFEKWRERISGIQLMIEELKTEDLILSLERKEIDLAIMAGPFNDSRLRTIPLFQEEILVYNPTIIGDKIDKNELLNLHPWLLSKGNCLRTQMIQFCQLKEESESDTWNYEGGNIELLLKMVDKFGGYSLVPENYHLNPVQSKALKSITTKGNSAVPAREIIAIIPNRSPKLSFLESLIREVQLFYNSGKEKRKMDILNWNGKN